MRRQSLPSAGATYLDRRQRVEEVRAAARRAAASLPSIKRMILFGSLQTGGATIRSDADILVVIDSGQESEADARDRIPDILRAMAPLPCPVDLFVTTPEELERALREQRPLARIAASTGVDLI